MDLDESSVYPSVLEAWDRHVTQALATPEGPSVQALLDVAKGPEGSSSPDALLTAIARESVTSEVQQAWAEWTAVTDRDELRLRLEVLQQVETLDPSLHAFVQFFFRASDPVLYQTAAVTVGTHLDRHPDLETYLQQFAKEHSVPSIVDRLLREARSMHEGSSSLPKSIREASWPADSSFGEGLRYVRSVLTAVREDPDWIEGLERLVGVLDPKSKDPATGARKVLGVLGTTGATALPLVH